MPWCCLQASAVSSAAATTPDTAAEDNGCDAKPEKMSTLQTAMDIQHGNSSGSTSTVQHVDPIGPCLQSGQATVYATGGPVIKHPGCSKPSV